MPAGRADGRSIDANYTFQRRADSQRMSPPGRPKGEYRSAQHEGTPVDPERRRLTYALLLSLLIRTLLLVATEPAVMPVAEPLRQAWVEQPVLT